MSTSGEAKNKYFSSEYRADDKTLVAKFSGNQRGISGRDFSQNIKKELLSSISDNDVKTLILDLENLDAMSSEGLGILLWPRTKLKEKNGENATVVISNPNELVSRLLTITNLNTIFDIREGSVEDIIATLKLDSK